MSNAAPMDSRTKIIALEQLPESLAGRPALLVMGLFDPLLAAHGERLEALAEPGVVMVAAVAEDPKELLEFKARLEMTAALRVVDFVLPLSNALPSAYAWRATHDDRELHGEWRYALIEHVRNRNQPR